MKNKKKIPLGLHLPKSFWEEFYKTPSMWRIIGGSLKCNIFLEDANGEVIKLYDNKTNTTHKHEHSR